MTHISQSDCCCCVFLDADLHCIAMTMLLEVLACSPSDVSLTFISKLHWIKVCDV